MIRSLFTTRALCALTVACLALVAFHFAPDQAAAAVPLLAAFPLTTLAADKARTYELGDHNHVGIIASDIVYEGAAVGDNASGYGRPLVAGDNFLGFAKEKVDNSSGSAGDKNIEMVVRGQIELTVSSAAITDVGRPIYASDDDTFTFTAAGNSFIGFVKRYVSSTKVLVAFDATDEGRSQAPLTASFTVAAQSGNGIAVAAQVKYLTGQDVAEARCLKWYLSTDSAGQVRVNPALGTDITVASGTDGVIIEDLADSSGFVTVESDGDADFNFTKVATGAETIYLNFVMPDGRIVTSGAITFT
jgi:hypothetical protein